MLTNSPTPNDPTSDVSQAEDISSSRERVDDSSVDVESVVSVVGQKERVGDAAKTKTEGERERDQPRVRSRESRENGGTNVKYLIARVEKRRRKEVMMICLEDEGKRRRRKKRNQSCRRSRRRTRRAKTYLFPPIASFKNLHTKPFNPPSTLSRTGHPRTVANAKKYSV